MQIRLGILKTGKTSIRKTPASFMIETIELTDDGCLLCSTSDLPAVKRIASQSFRVTLKYIHKPEDLFIKVTGRAEIPDHAILQNSLTPSSRTGNEGGSLLIKVRIDEAYCFQKKCTSPYTSFLQSLNTFTANIPQIGQAV